MGTTLGLRISNFENQGLTRKGFTLFSIYRGKIIVLYELSVIFRFKEPLKHKGHQSPAMVKGYCHAHVVELRILHRMAKLGYKSKEIQSVLGRSKAWVTRHSKRLGRSQAAKKTKRVGAPCKITPRFAHMYWLYHVIPRQTIALCG